MIIQTVMSFIQLICILQVDLQTNLIKQYDIVYIEKKAQFVLHPVSEIIIKSPRKEY